MHKLPTIKDVSALLISLKKYIADDYRAFDGDNRPGMCVTIGVNPKTGEWDYQTGDNSYSGAAYFYKHWGVGYLYRNSNCRELAKQMIDDAVSCIH